MSYVDGFVRAVPTANREKFITHARTGDAVFLEYGARRVVECWGDNVPHGTQTDFFRCVQAREDGTEELPRIEWPGKATRDAALEKRMDAPRMDPATTPMPFDGKRLFYGGFVPVLDLQP